MTIRAQVVLKGRSGIAEDQFVNTFHIDSTEQDIEAAATVLGPMLRNIWNTGAGSGQLAHYISNFVDRTFNRSEVRFYDLDTPKPRVPFIWPWTIDPAAAGTGDLPEEVALCGSFHGIPPRTARRRGRVFLGPFNTNALGLDPEPSDFGPARPNTLLRQAVAVALNTFLTVTEVQAGYDWVILSPTNGTVTKVQGGWVDDAWDTQRRRGVDPSTRTIWGNV